MASRKEALPKIKVSSANSKLISFGQPLAILYPYMDSNFKTCSNSLDKQFDTNKKRYGEIGSPYCTSLLGLNDDDWRAIYEDIISNS